MRSPTGQQATTLLERMTIRAFHSKILRRFSLGTTIGFRIQRGILTDIPAILVFVACKVHKQWLSHVQCLPEALEVRKLVLPALLWPLFLFEGHLVYLTCLIYDWLHCLLRKLSCLFIVWARDQEECGVMWML